MKSLLTITALLLLFTSCKKELQPSADEYFEKVQRQLKDRLSSTDYAHLNFSSAVISRVDSIGLYVVRVPFQNTSLGDDFIAVKTNEAGRIEVGKIVHLEGGIDTVGLSGKKGRSWNGSIELSSLDRTSHFFSPVVDGYITAYHQQTAAKATVLQAGMMPEVVIVSTIHHSGIDFSGWMMLQSFFSDTGAWGGYYGCLTSDGSGFNSGGFGSGPTGVGATGGGGSGPSIEPPMLIDYEAQDEKTPIDIEKFVNCFGAIPDAGATCTIEILADIPVDSDPNKIFNIVSKSPGHTFLNIRKSNSNQSVSQNIGFYPKSGIKAVLTTDPIDGKFVDNGQHEFNCGFTLTITPAQFNSALLQMQRAKNYKYDIDNYNCTDWAMDVFNAAGGNFQIPLYDIPDNNLSVGTRMPNGVYNKLKEMKAAGDPRSSGITIGILKGYAGNSTGPCN